MVAGPLQPRFSDRVGVRAQAPGSHACEKERRREPSGGGDDDPVGRHRGVGGLEPPLPSACHGHAPAAAGDHLPGQRQQNALETCARSMWRRRVRSTRGFMGREFSRCPPGWSRTSRTGLALRTRRTSPLLRDTPRSVEAGHRRVRPGPALRPARRWDGQGVAESAHPPAWRGGVRLRAAMPVGAESQRGARSRPVFRRAYRATFAPSVIPASSADLVWMPEKTRASTFSSESCFQVV